MAYRCVLPSTDKGTVQKVIVLPRDDLQTEELVLEEVEVFKVSCYYFVYLPVSLSLIQFLPPMPFSYFVSVSMSLALTMKTVLTVIISSIKVPTPITTMKISSKRVSVSAQPFLNLCSHKEERNRPLKKPMMIRKGPKLHAHSCISLLCPSP